MLKIHLPLGIKIFLMSLFLIITSMAVVIGLTFKVGNSIANNSATKALDKSVVLHKKFIRADARELLFQVTGFTSDPNFVGYIDNALYSEDSGSGVDLNSIFDLVLERREDTDLDFIIVLDDEAELVVHSERPGLRSRSYMEHPLVSPVYDELIVNFGFWLEDNRLFQAVVVPMDLDLELAGFIIAGREITVSTANELKSVSDSNIMFVIAEQNNYLPIATTQNQSVSKNILDALSSQSKFLGMLDDNVRIPIKLTDQQLAIEVIPLGQGDDQQESKPLMLIISSVDQYLEDYQRIFNVILLAGILAIALALVLSYILSYQVLRPVTRLADTAEAAARGDYRKSLRRMGKDELARLSLAFDNLLSDLRDKQDMQAFLTNIYDNLPEQDTQVNSVRNTSNVSRGYLVILALDIDLISSGFSEDKNKLQSNFSKLVSSQENQHGELLAIIGGICLFGFAGTDSAVRAYSAVAALSVQIPALFSPKLKYKFAISEGECISGDLSIMQKDHAFVSGTPIRQCLRLLQEAADLQCIVTPKIYKFLKDPLAKENIVPSTMKGRLTGKTFCVLDIFAGDKLKIDSPETLSTDATLQMTMPIIAGDTRSQPVLPQRYNVLGVLGNGAMGVVYKAFDRELNATVAIKVLRVEGGLDQNLLTQIKSEITLARRITHQNVLRTFDIGDANGEPFITMEYVRGMTLDYLISATGRIPYSAGLKVARQLCAGLQAVHDLGVIHRDIKPSNVILEPNGNVKIMDFGIACQIRDSELDKGMFIGTPEYASPEQVRASDLDNRSDIYSCGVVFTEMFTGFKPFKGNGYREVCMAHLNDPPIAPSALWPDVPKDLEIILLKCLEKDRSMRYGSIEELSEKLGELKA